MGADSSGRIVALTSIADEAKIALDGFADRLSSLAAPSLRLGVTGLSRAGKTVFIAAFVHNLIHGGRLPLFEAQKSRRISRAFLEPQPDDAVPRFDYESHVRELVENRIWPQSTRAVSELRLTINYESASAWNRLFSRGSLSVDIVDYPGEWLLDLPLLGKSYAQFSAEAFELAQLPLRSDLSAAWRAMSSEHRPDAPASETEARQLAPGRFLMPGDLEGSPALTFAPLPGLDSAPIRPGSLAAMMERRYESYKTHVVKPFFREHVARLDRQIVLVDAMQAMNAGPHALTDLERAMTSILECFRQGRTGLLTGLFGHRIDRILIAATKADQLHHEGHDRLQALARRLADHAIERASFTGAEIEVLALAAVRSTREGTVKHGKETLPVIIGVPMPGEEVEGQKFDGKAETALFPGDLPKNPDTLFEVGKGVGHPASDTRFIRFRPPSLETSASGVTLSLPHIRLDRAMQFLIGDHLS
jgi:uncharacterized protein